MYSYVIEAVNLLRKLIETPRYSREEGAAADLIEEHLRAVCGLKPQRVGNNLWVVSEKFEPEKTTVLLNAHIDTVRPCASWTRNPHTATLEGDTLYGLGSNDCGGGLVALLAAFRILNGQTNCNLVYLASAEEEVSGQNGIVKALPLLPKIDVAIVGEPTGMQPAVAEKGLMVVDGVAKGKSGHAARDEGENALYKALDDIQWIRNYRFPKVSDLLGLVKTTVTVINAGSQHNVIPDECRFTIDVRSNELYTNQEILAILQAGVKSELKERSFRLGSSHIAIDHPLVRLCTAEGLKPFGSPTLSDQALMPFTSMKWGPGDSARSHSADEFIRISEIEQAVKLYTKILSAL